MVETVPFSEMNKPRCLVVFPYDCHASGGIRNAAVGLVRTLVHAGCVVDVASPRSGNPQEGKWTQLGGADVRSFHYYTRGNQDMNSFVAPDIDFVFLWWCTGDSAQFAKAARKRAIAYLWYSGGIFQCRSAIRLLAKTLWFNFAPFIRHASAIVVPTVKELKQANALTPVNRHKVVTIAHEIPSLPPSVGATLENIRDRPFTFGFLGRIDVDTKGLDLLVQAFVNGLKKGWPARLSIAGPDTKGGLSRLRALVPTQFSTNSLIEFRGSVYGDDKEKWFSEIDCYVQLSRHEGFGITIVEAMQRRKAVMLSNKCNITPEILDAGAGISCDPEIISIERTLKATLSKEADELRRMGEAGRQWVEKNCNIDHVAAKTIALLNRIQPSR